MPVTSPERAKALNLCSVFAKNAGEDPVGSAWSMVRTLLIELPLPWPYHLLSSKHVPPGVPEAVARLYELHPDWGMIAIAPDPEYAVENRIRIIDLQFGPVPRSIATQRDILVAREDVAATFNALIDGEPLPAGAVIDETPYRDMLICTHGSIDACCATFGFPAYRHLKSLAAESPNVRVWRSSHFGGHRFAPTLLDLPDGRFWAFLDDTTSATLLNRGADLDSLRSCYRGWAGYEHPSEQLLEREGFLREGWDWLAWPQASEILDRDQHDEPLRLAITAYPPDRAPIRYEGRVECFGEIETMNETGGEIVKKQLHRIADLSRTIVDAT